MHHKEFDDYIAKFRAHSKNIEREADLAHMIVSVRTRKVQAENHALQLRSEKINRRDKVLSCIPAVDYVSKQANLSRLRHPGTCTWLESVPEYQSWLSSTHSSCLCCYGIPGSGKSVLAASLKDRLQDQASSNPRVAVCYYYCDHADAASLDVFRILASLTKQLLEVLPLAHFDDGFVCPFSDNGSSPSIVQSTHYLRSLMLSLQCTYIILDGLDELNQDNQRCVLDFINTLLQDTGVLVKLCTTSRTEEVRIKKALQAHSTFRLAEHLIAQDIALYIGDEIGLIDSPHPLSHDPELRQEVISALVAGAKGM